MFKFKLFSLLFAACFLVAATVYTIEWKVRDDYSVIFTSKNSSGYFRGLEGQLQFDENDLEHSSFDMRIATNTIDLGGKTQTKHARSEMWFDVEQYPYITFKSSRIERGDSGFVTIGDLKIRDHIMEVSIPFTFHDNTFSGSFEVDRKEFDLGPTKGMAGKASEIIQIQLNIPVSR